MNDWVTLVDSVNRPDDGVDAPAAFELGRQFGFMQGRLHEVESVSKSFNNQCSADFESKLRIIERQRDHWRHEYLNAMEEQERLNEDVSDLRNRLDLLAKKYDDRESRLMGLRGAILSKFPFDKVEYLMDILDDHGIPSVNSVNLDRQVRAGGGDGLMNNLQDDGLGE